MSDTKTLPPLDLDRDIKRTRPVSRISVPKTPDTAKLPIITDHTRTSARDTIIEAKRIWAKVIREKDSSKILKETDSLDKIIRRLYTEIDNLNCNLFFIRNDYTEETKIRRDDLITLIGNMMLEIKGVERVRSEISQLYVNLLIADGARYCEKRQPSLRELRKEVIFLGRHIRRLDRQHDELTIELDIAINSDSSEAKWDRHTIEQAQKNLSTCTSHLEAHNKQVMEQIKHQESIRSGLHSQSHHLNPPRISPTQHIARLSVHSAQRDPTRVPSRSASRTYHLPRQERQRQLINT